ncbi:class I tRNA ligase family protein, partial [Francisella tularensis subsp. holarctica]|uniref:class I tRNA ligase family protein n=1 Tax=Francisella tularensis TaxID=263 RepID=UPI002381C580
MNKYYYPKEIALSYYKNWLASGKFACGNTDSKDTYTIMLAPQNLTGTLLLGDGFQRSLMDLLIRSKRMS